MDENDCYDFGDPKRSDYHEHKVYTLKHLSHLDYLDGLGTRAERANYEKEWAMHQELNRIRHDQRMHSRRYLAVRGIARSVAWLVIVAVVMLLAWLFVVILGHINLNNGLDERPPVRIAPVLSVHPPCLPSYLQCDQSENPWRISR